MIYIATTYFLAAALLCLYFAINSISLIKKRQLVIFMASIEIFLGAIVVVYSILNQIYILTFLFGILMIVAIPFIFSKNVRDQMFHDVETIDFNYELFAFFYYALLGSLIYFFLLVQ
jgi:hypothetical protein|tara:strand:+ start:718 stop:1068 length:351 start_codon:yes stop_codon:yes gene_type:complete